MFGVFLITLRKEFKELFCSFHSWICFFFIVIFPFLALLKGIDFPSYAFVLVVAVSVCQYTYDSFQNDTESKGAVFLSNIKADFRTVYLAKLIVALVEGLICFCYGYRWIKDLFRFKDILWLSLALICFIGFYNQILSTASYFRSCRICFNSARQGFFSFTSI